MICKTLFQAYVKSFNMCFDLEDFNEIFCALFSLMFKIVNDEHSGKDKGLTSLSESTNCAQKILREHTIL